MFEQTNDASIRQVLPDTNPILKQVSSSVSFPLSVEDQQLIVDLIATMRHHSALGIAAPQIGVSKRIFIVENFEAIPLIFINPIITYKSTETVKLDEGCLSSLGKTCKINRSETIRYRNQTPEGRVEVNKASGMTARAILHENDHLDGILMIDRQSKLKKLLNLKKVKLR